MNQHLQNEYRPKGIQMMFEYWQDKAEYKWVPEVLESCLFFNTAAAIQLRNTRIVRETNSGKKTLIPNYMGILFGTTGIGKSYGMSLTAEPFNKMFETFISKAEMFSDDPINRNDRNELERRYIKITSPYIPVTSSPEGIQKYAQTVSDMGYAGVNVTNDELGNTIGKMEPIFVKLKQGFDTGTSEGSVIASDGGDAYFTVNDVCYNAMLLGSPGMFIQDPKLKQLLLMHYISGMARRAFIFHDDKYKKSENRNKIFETMSSEDIDEVNNYMKELRSHINHLKEIKYPNEVRQQLVEWDIQKEVIRETSESLISDDIGSPRKIERLAGIIAVLDLSDTIEPHHMEYAIDYSERVDVTAEASVKIKPLYEQIYDELEKRGFVSRTELIRDIKGLTIKNLPEEMTLAIEYANEVGNSIVSKEYSGIVKYKLEKLTQTNLDKVVVSINKNPSATESKGWEKKHGNFWNLHKIVCSSTRYSAGVFLHGHITNDNYLSEQNLIIIDVDDGITIEETKSLFKNTIYMIATTKSHQIEKNGEIRDRFRLVLPTLSKFHLKPEVYSATYMNILGALGMSEADTQCKNASRWYYGFPDGEHWYNQEPEAKLLDIRPFIPDTSEHHSGSDNVDKMLSLKKNGGEHSETEVRLEGAYKWFLARTSSGTRSDMIFRFGAMIKQHYPGENYENHIRQFNSIISDPIRESELLSIIRSVDRNAN